MATRIIHNIKLEWHLFSLGHINSKINWKLPLNHYNTSNLNYDFTLQSLNYWTSLKYPISLEKTHISYDEIRHIFIENVCKQIPIYDNEAYILAPIYISQYNEWHIAIVFLLDNTPSSYKMYRKLLKLYYETVKTVMFLIPLTATYYKFQRLHNDRIWLIGNVKMRINHILLGIIPYL